MRVPRFRAALALATVLAAAGCSPAQEAPGSPFDGSRGSEEVLLTVENNDFRDATIHVYWNGMRTRAGTVTGKTSETFRLRWGGEWAHFGVDFLGSGGYETERVPVDPGDHLNFVIMVGR
ncbi:MAG TPA: hypothetical protein VM198_13475 [Longimicrobiales bacterium]|nr:hypothetical protein [Longimicrobiales bacterium]